MQPRRILSALKWVYFAVLLAATGVGVWAIRPYFEEQSAKRASPLAVHVYSHPFVSVLKETAIGARSAASVDRFFPPEVLSEATADFLKRRPLPFPKGADADAWSRELAADLTASMNTHMARRYIDSLQRLQVTNEAKGLVLVRVENTSAAALEDVRVEVMGGQLFMEGTPTAAKFRSLGARAVRLTTVAPGEKINLSVLTTEDMSPGGAGPHVKVTAKDQTFPVIVHPLDTPSRPTQRDAAWAAFAVSYVALILAGIGVAGVSLLKTPAPATAKKTSGPTNMAAALPTAAPVQLTTAEAKAWQRPGTP